MNQIDIYLCITFYMNKNILILKTLFQELHKVYLNVLTCSGGRKDTKDSGIARKKITYCYCYITASLLENKTLSASVTLTVINAGGGGTIILC